MIDNVSYCRDKETLSTNFGYRAEDVERCFKFTSQIDNKFVNTFVLHLLQCNNMESYNNVLKLAM